MKTKIAAQLIYYFIRLLNLTYRFEFKGLDHKERALQLSANHTFAYALWHQNLVAAILAHINREKFTMIISESKDGELAAVTCEKLGHVPTRGSSTRGGKKALIEIVQNIKNGHPGAITVDGPKGPPHVVKPGIIEIARLCQCPILPLSPYASSQFIFKKSWDQFRIPLPFSKIVMVIGEPIIVDENITSLEFEELRVHLRDKINEGEVSAINYFAR